MKNELLEPIKKSCETCEWYETYDEDYPLCDDEEFCKRNAYSEYKRSQKDIERVEKSINLRKSNICNNCKFAGSEDEGDFFCRRYQMDVFCFDVCDAYERMEMCS